MEPSDAAFHALGPCQGAAVEPSASAQPCLLEAMSRSLTTGRCMTKPLTTCFLAPLTV